MKATRWMIGILVTLGMNGPLQAWTELPEPVEAPPISAPVVDPLPTTGPEMPELPDDCGVGTVSTAPGF